MEISYVSLKNLTRPKGKRPWQKYIGLVTKRSILRSYIRIPSDYTGFPRKVHGLTYLLTYLLCQFPCTAFCQNHCRLGIVTGVLTTTNGFGRRHGGVEGSSWYPGHAIHVLSYIFPALSYPHFQISFKSHVYATTHCESKYVFQLFSIYDNLLEVIIIWNLYNCWPLLSNAWSYTQLVVEIHPQKSLPVAGTRSKLWQERCLDNNSLEIPRFICNQTCKCNYTEVMQNAWIPCSSSMLKLWLCNVTCLNSSLIEFPM